VGRDGEARKVNALAVALFAGLTLEDASRHDLTHAPPFSSVLDQLRMAANPLRRKAKRTDPNRGLLNGWMDVTDDGFATGMKSRPPKDNQKGGPLCSRLYRKQKEECNSIRGRIHMEDMNFYKFVLQSLPVAVITVNHEMKVTGFNPMAERITGYTQAEALGRFCGDVLVGGMCDLKCPLRQVLSRSGPLVEIDTTIQNKDGDRIPVHLHVGGLFDEDGKLIGGVEAFMDVSRLKALERERANIISMLAHDMKSPLGQHPWVRSEIDQEDGSASREPKTGISGYHKKRV
jgi:PAS domain S-box-containing protein